MCECTVVHTGPCNACWAVNNNHNKESLWWAVWCWISLYECSLTSNSVELSCWLSLDFDNLVLCFGPNHVLGFTFRLGPSWTIDIWSNFNKLNSLSISKKPPSIVELKDLWTGPPKLTKDWKSPFSSFVKLYYNSKDIFTFLWIDHGKGENVNIFKNFQIL